MNYEHEFSNETYIDLGNGLLLRKSRHAITNLVYFTSRRRPPAGCRDYS
jgi:hypothetical protein